MKLIYCRKCRTMVSLPASGELVKCHCGASAGKYIDGVNAVVNIKKNKSDQLQHPISLVLGIDNNTFNTAIVRHKMWFEDPPEWADVNERMDFYFVGWLPTIPGEVFIVGTVEDVEKAKAEDFSNLSTTSTRPATNRKENERTLN